MPDFFDRLAGELNRAALASPAPSPKTRRRSRRRAIRRPALLAVPALAILGTGAAFATGVLFGAPTGPATTPVSSGNGAAVTSGLLGLRVADPAGGLPWGMRLVRTTRDDACLQVGRVTGASIGVVGEDAAFADDGRFHPLTPNYEDPVGCLPLDAHGHGFASFALTGLPASAEANSGCLTEPTDQAHPDPCPAEDRRDVYFGLLGAAAVGITYDLQGRQVTEATVGAQGAYLIVTRSQPGEVEGVGSQTFAGLAQGGPISAVMYRDGRTCRPTPDEECAAVGWVPASTPARSGLESAVQVDEVRASPTSRQEVIRISYTARVAVTTAGNFYYVSLSFPANSGCHQIGMGMPTSSNLRSGERIVVSDPVAASCHGIIRGSVRYHPASAVHSAAPAPQADNPGDVVVGRFELTVGSSR